MVSMASFILLLPAILIAITVHEYSHAKVADMLGDPTPRYSGRLTLNPLSHIDPIGFIMLLIVRFGWAKPVPINPYNFSDPPKGTLYVSLAGPVSNFFVAWVAGLMLKISFLLLPGIDLGIIGALLYYFIWINLALGIFNLIPVPPLDGFGILQYFLPPQFNEVADNLERYGFFILILILLFPPTQLMLYSTIEFFYRLIT